MGGARANAFVQSEGGSAASFPFPRPFPFLRGCERSPAHWAPLASSATEKASSRVEKQLPGGSDSGRPDSHN